MQRYILISRNTSALFGGNLCYNTRFGLPKIVLKIFVRETVRDRVTFLLDGSLDACLILPCMGITEVWCLDSSMTVIRGQDTPQYVQSVPQ